MELSGGSLPKSLISYAVFLFPDVYNMEEALEVFLDHEGDF